MRYIDEVGMRAAMEEALAGMDADTHLHVSFDVDFLDPSIAPGVGTTVMGGPTYRESQLCMEMIADTGRLGSLDIVELVTAIETEFDIEIPDDEAEKIRTVQDAIDYIVAHVS